MNKEIWKDIPGYEGLYQVSDMGRVKSLARVILQKNGVKIPVREHILKAWTDGSGYLQVGLHHTTYKVAISIHQLVAMAFLGHQPCGHQLVVDHKNNCKTDNTLENLQVITTLENNLKDRETTSKYVGVCWDKSKKKWKAYIKLQGKSKTLGYFLEEELAHEAYQRFLKVTS